VHKFNPISQVAPMCPALPGEYDGAFCLWRRCCLMSNYVDCLLSLATHTYAIAQQ